MRDPLVRRGTGPDLDTPGQQARTQPRGWDVVAVIAAGGVLGAEGRYGLAEVLGHRVGAVPWATLVINVAGCLLIGVLMVVLTEVAGRPHRLARPFLGVGVLGGLTTFSTYTVETRELVATGEPRLALGYLFGTVVASLAAVQVGIAVTRLLAGPRRRREASR